MVFNEVVQGERCISLRSVMQHVCSVDIHFVDSSIALLNQKLD